MKRIISVILIIMLLVLSLPFGGLISSAQSDYSMLASYSDNAWSSDVSGEKISVNRFYMTAGENNMAASGYTVEQDGEYSFSVGLLIDAQSAASVPEGTDAFGFMVLEKRSNTILYPSSKSAFYTLKNTKVNQQATTTVSGSYTAKAGDEIVFIVRNELSGVSPSLQVIAEINRVTEEGTSLIASNYEGFSDTQGKNNWRFYSIPESGFNMPKVSPNAAVEITNGFVEMKYFNENWWWVSSGGKTDTTSPFYSMAIGTHTQPPAPGYMTARGYKIPSDGVVTFSGTVLLDINAHMNCKEGADTIGFMVIEKNSNTILYPTDSADFKVFKNTAENRKTPTALSGKFDAKAGDEILFITKNLTEDAHPSVQVIMNVSVNGQKVANTHEGYSNTQGKNNWRYYYASNSTFKKPIMPAKDIFSASQYLDERNSEWYLTEEAASDLAVKSHNAKITADTVTVTDKYGAALSYKAASGGKVSFSAVAEVKTEETEVGFAVVKKSTFAFCYPSTKAEYKTLSVKDGKVEISGSINASRLDEFLFVLLPVNVKESSDIAFTIDVGGKGTAELGKMFATAEDIYKHMLGREYSGSNYIDPSAPGFKDIVFDPIRLTKFDEKKWMWYTNSWDDPASDGYMSILMENAQVGTKNYSMIRSYTAQSDCTISVYGNVSSEIPEFLGVNTSQKNLDFAICNSKGQLIFPEDRTGFYTFSADELKPEKPLLVNASCDINKGEKVYIIFRNRSDADFAYLYTHLQIFETPVGENPTVPVTGAADGFSSTQGENGWNYYYALNDTFRFVEGTEFEKLPSAPGLNNVDKDEDVDKKAETGDTLLKVIFFISAGLDFAAIAALAVFIILKLKRKNGGAAEAPTE